MNTKADSLVHLFFAVLMALTALAMPAPARADPPGTADGVSVISDQGANTGDPISANSGAYHFAIPLLDLGGPLPLRFTLSYRMDAFSGPGMLGRFHTDLLPSLEQMLHQTTGERVAEVYLHDGNTLQFTYDAGAGQWNLDAAPPVRYVLKETGADFSQGYYYLLDPVQEVVYIFQKVTAQCWLDWCPARIVYVMDRHENRHTYTYTGDNLAPDRVEDGLGRRLDFSYDAGVLESVTDQSGRSVQLNDELSAPDCDGLQVYRSVTDAQGNTTTFHYSPEGCTVVAVERPGGNTPYSQTVANVTLNNRTYRRVTSQTDADGNTTSFAYDSAVNRVTETRADGSVVTYQHYHNDGVPKSITDATGKTINFSQSSNEQVTQVTDRLGDNTNITYHTATGKMASYQDAAGNTTAATYTAQSQTFTNPATLPGAAAASAETVDFTFYDLTRITYADATHADLTYDAQGNVLTFTDPRGKTWTYTYNGRGQVLTAANPQGGTTIYTYNDVDGTLATSTDSDAGTGVTTYAYDLQKRLITVTRPGGATVAFTYDANDRPLTVTDERGETTTFGYDANGNLDTVTDALDQTTVYAQDLMDQVASVTDPLAHSSAYTYDTMQRPATVTDRNGNTTTYSYNSRGWRTGVTDAAGQTWTTAYDDEGVPTSTTTPLGFTTAYQTDNLGRVTRITDPAGQVANLSYDALGRLATLTDRMGRTTTYSYDATGLLAGVIRPVIGTATYTRDDAGRLTRIADLRGENWDFSYSPMGRLTSQTDPLGHSRTYAYDGRGRLAGVTYAGGSGTAAYTYDGASNITQIAYSGGPTLDFTYDDAGRLLTASRGGVTPPLQLTYDGRGDITGSRDGAASFGATYDAGQRVKTVSYDGQATATYTYNSRDLLARVEDNRAHARMDFAYDDDGRLTTVTRSNGVNTTYTYDNAGRVTRIQDGPSVGAPLGDQQFTLNAEGEPIQAVRTLPLDPPPAVGQIADLIYDDASQISSAGYAYDARGRQTVAPGKTFSYDGADRLTQVAAGGSTASFTYNGLDDLRTRTLDGTTTTYYHNYAFGLAPIVAEHEGASYKRLYVYTPDGSLLYAIDPATDETSFYHYDRVGSTLFLTDAAGAVSDAYAYDPFGNLLARTGASDQPFAYVGRYGVRREPVGELYDMRARAYDPAAARFLTRDPVWPDLRDPAGQNPYQYGYQNPLRYVDPGGTAHIETKQGASSRNPSFEGVTDFFREVNRKLLLIVYRDELIEIVTFQCLFATVGVGWQLAMGNPDPVAVLETHLFIGSPERTMRGIISNFVDRPGAAEILLGFQRGGSGSMLAYQVLSHVIPSPR